MQAALTHEGIIINKTHDKVCKLHDTDVTSDKLKTIKI